MIDLSKPRTGVVLKVTRKRGYKMQWHYSDGDDNKPAWVKHHQVDGVKFELVK